MSVDVSGLRAISRLLLLSFLLAACARSTPTPPARSIALRLVTVPGLRPLAQALGDAFTKQTPYLALHVREARADVAREAVVTGDADLALVRGAAEMAPLPGVRTVIVGREPIVVAVHPDNPVRSLTWAQLQAIFSGDVWDWNTIDPRWKSQEILVVVQHEGAPARRIFERQVMAGRPITRRALIAPGDAAAQRLIADDPAAIGYLAADFIAAGVRVLQVSGVSPTPDAVTSQAWPLSQPLWLLYGEEASVYALDFVDFVRSAQGQTIVGRRYGRLGNPEP